MAKKLFRLQVDIDENYIVMLEYLRRFHQISKRRKLLELVILDAVLDVASLPKPKNLTPKQNEGYEWCRKMAVEYAKPFEKLLQKRKIDRDKPHKIKKVKQKRPRRKR